ncbi:MAG: hypothetical protein PHG79_03230 [Methanosarcina sp.]|nr:hypothetical protein [Methanosarcina sp.]MDD3873813.1 hypothetical protein [Methanosarcina sp.]MDD4522293.1 hypothetical protein [Methanosarcina sp.]HHV23420.1 hypothetical protein [Methanosarcina sp.]
MIEALIDECKWNTQWDFYWNWGSNRDGTRKKDGARKKEREKKTMRNRKKY